jgi:putative acetyltransferase
MHLTGLATPHDFQEIESVWEASVRATHHFLSEADIDVYRSMFPACLIPLDIYCSRSNNRITGFIGVAAKKVEMLFVHPEERGKGLGSALMHFAMKELHVDKVDVNEENSAAMGFYFNLGFRIRGRSALDGMCKPHPLLHLELEPD